MVLSDLLVGKMNESAARWLAQAWRGHCGETASGRGNCAREASGSWPLGTVSLVDAATVCLRWCQLCANCRFISISARWHDCSWFSRCDKLTDNPADFHSGRDTLPKRLISLPGYGHHRRLAPPFAPTECARIPSRPQISVTHFAGDRTGFQFEALLNALTHAACCASIAVLPTDATRYFHSSIARPRCFNFSALPRDDLLPAASCKPLARSSEYYFYHLPCDASRFLDPTHQHRGFYYSPRHAAALAALAYFDRERVAGGCAGSAKRTLVAHVRSGDIFTGGGAHGGYSQPPLDFYLSAWKLSRLPKMLVISERGKSPVVQALVDLERTMPEKLTVQLGGTLEGDMATFMCAEHIALANSKLSNIFLANERLRSAYAFWPLDSDVRVASCRANVWVVGTEAVPVLQDRDRDLDPAALVRSWNMSSALRFRRQTQVECLGLERDGLPLASGT